MNEDQSRTAQSLRALCQQAGAQAAGWRSAGDASSMAARAPRAAAVPAESPQYAQPFDRFRANGHGRRLLKLSVVAASGLLALAVLAAHVLSEQAPPPEPARPAATLPSPVAALTLPASAAADPAAPVRWQGGELWVDFDSVPLPQAVAQLAQATGTTVAGSQWLHQAVSVTLHLRSSEASAAWQHLLQGHALYSISCGVSNCQVWITGAAASGAPDAGRPLSEAPAEPQRVPMSAAEAELEQSQPDGSC